MSRQAGIAELLGDRLRESSVSSMPEPSADTGGARTLWGQGPGSVDGAETTTGLRPDRPRPPCLVATLYRMLCKRVSENLQI